MKIRLLGIFHSITIVSMVVAGLIGAGTMAWMGDALGQGAALYLGASSPDPPGLDYPWWITLTSAGGSLAFLALGKHLNRWVSTGGSMVLAIICVLLPWVQFFRLAAAALASGATEPGF